MNLADIITTTSPIFTDLGPAFQNVKVRSKCDYQTLQPTAVCRLDCAGTPGGGKTIDVCGVCGGDGSTCTCSGAACSSTSPCPVSNCTICCGCKQVGKIFQALVPDACGKCGGDGSSCLGCDNVPYSGQVFDACGKCGGNNESCVGCDGIINSGQGLRPLRRVRWHEQEMGRPR